MELQYKTFNQLMSSVSSDLGRYADEGMIDEILYIKEARKVNAELGLKINKEKEIILDVVNYKACLPEDFQYLQLALACSISYVTVPKIQGVHTEDKVIPLINLCTACGQTPCNCQVQFKACDGYKYVAQTIGIKTYKHEHLDLLSVTKASHRFCSDYCLNLNFRSPNVMNILGEEATFSFRSGKVYINYLSDMTDDKGNFLILDHPLTNDYYEYAVKKKFFENMKFNKDGDVTQDLQYVITQLREARIRAISLVNMPEYDEINEHFARNRQRFYNNYVKYFNNDDEGGYKF
jgi:hypothetical protein